MKIKISFFSIIIFVSLFLTNAQFSIAAICSATIHELGHIFISKLLGINFSSLSLDIFGAKLTKENELYSYNDEIIVCTAGPAANFILFFVAEAFLSYHYNEFLLNLSLSSLILGTMNLLPIYGFDGAHILSALLNKIFSPFITQKIMSALSFIIIFFLWCFSVYLVLKISASLSLFVFSSMLFVKLFIPTGQ